MESNKLEDILEKINFIKENYVMENDRKSLEIIKENEYFEPQTPKENRNIDSKRIEEVNHQLEDILKEQKVVIILIYSSQLSSFSYKQLEKICKNTQVYIKIIEDV